MRRFPQVGVIEVVIAATVVLLAVMAWRTSRLPLTATATDAELQAMGRDIASIRSAVIRFARATGRFPEATSALVPQYLAELPLDPYGRPYVFIDGGPDLIWVFSLGSDGKMERYPPDVGTPIQMSEVWKEPSGRGR